jgi:thiamine-phosphate pyrophosphorylase
LPRLTGKNNIDISRIIDANINRAKEGLRVCEEIARFILESRSLTASLKNIRHKISSLSKQLCPQAKLFSGRNSAKDTGRRIYTNELKRTGVGDILFANMQRAKEAVRVLEEFAKLIEIKTAISFKEIRYELYELEKKIGQKI